MYTYVQRTLLQSGVCHGLLQIFLGVEQAPRYLEGREGSLSELKDMYSAGTL